MKKSIRLVCDKKRSVLMEPPKKDFPCGGGDFIETFWRTATVGLFLRKYNTLYLNPYDPETYFIGSVDGEMVHIKRYTDGKLGIYDAMKISHNPVATEILEWHGESLYLTFKEGSAMGQSFGKKTVFDLVKGFSHTDGEVKKLLWFTLFEKTGDSDFATKVLAETHVPQPDKLIIAISA